MDVMYKPIELARSLAAEIATRADEADRLGRLPAEDVALLRESGYLALAVPAEYGGRGASLHTCVAAQLELAAGSASTALVAAMQHQIAGHQREIRSWRADAYEQIMREAAAGELMNYLASEPALGSPSRGGLPETTAKPINDGEYLIINGHKTWSTGGRHLTHMLVRVAIGDEPGVVLVRQGTPGIEWVETWGDTLSLRASDSHDVFFRDVVVPRENLIETGDAKAMPNVWFPMMLAAVYLGTAIAARDAVIRYALERVPTALGQPIATLPKIQRQIGEIDIGLQASKAFLLAVAGDWTGDNEERPAFQPRIAAAKTAVMEAATMATERALEVAGGAAITRDLPLERYFRDVRAGQMQPPSGDTALEMVGRAALGL
jgi:alkylation response protein AidB-like acyl-CoA dehydrogenase